MRAQSKNSNQMNSHELPLMALYQNVTGIHVYPCSVAHICSRAAHPSGPPWTSHGPRFSQQFRLILSVPDPLLPSNERRHRKGACSSPRFLFSLSRPSRIQLPLSISCKVSIRSQIPDQPQRFFRVPPKQKHFSSIHRSTDQNNQHV